jgi:CMP-N,N'-diacetyllegionaminic acid synthase
VTASEPARVLAVIPAKAHSTRLPGKNLLPLGGLPLFLWTVQAALAVEPKMDVVVSTDEGPDGDLIAQVALRAGAFVVRRPPDLCRDPAQMPDVVLHALSASDEGHETVVALLPTSPFRSAQDIQSALALHQVTPTDGFGRPNVVSVTSAEDFLHHKLCQLADGVVRQGPPLRDFHLRASLTTDGFYANVFLNGAIWIATPERLRRDRHISAIGALPYVMDEESGLDIDSPLDYEVAKAIVARRYQVAA